MPTPNETVRLGPWDQTARRSYHSAVLCFPMDNNHDDDAFIWLTQCIARVSLQHPVLAGQVELGEGPRSGFVHVRQPLSTAPHNTLQLQRHNLDDFFRYTYRDLKQSNFKSSLFVNHTQFHMDDIAETGKVPVAVAHAVFIDGGLLLFFSLHGSVGDVESLRAVLRCIAAMTRDTPESLLCIKDGLTSLPLGGQSGMFKPADIHIAQVLANETEEFELTDGQPGPMAMLPGPVSPENGAEFTSRIFRFKQATLSTLTKAVSDVSTTSSLPVTEKTVLAGLIWAAVFYARTEAASRSSLPQPPSDGNTCMLIPVDLRGEILLGGTRGMAGALGNATGTAVASANRGHAYGVALGAKKEIADLAQLVHALEGSIAQINSDKEGFVSKRTDLFHAIPDPRALGSSINPHFPDNLRFSDLRSCGADEKWNIPGVGRSNKPDAVRVPMGEYQGSAAMILPGPWHGNMIEVMVVLPKDAMEVLLENKRWKKWVHEVVHE